MHMRLPSSMKRSQATIKRRGASTKDTITGDRTYGPDIVLWTGKVVFQPVMPRSRINQTVSVIGDLQGGIGSHMAEVPKSAPIGGLNDLIIEIDGVYYLSMDRPVMVGDSFWMLLLGEAKR